MFLALQARSSSALSSRHPSVSALKNCWDILKCETRPFLTLVTSAFPCAKDQDAVLNELRNSGYFDVFEHCSINAGGWGCFLCNHPERAVGFLQDSQPVIEGQLKEKKGRWRLFRRWRTRYFTLSGAHLSYKGSVSWTLYIINWFHLNSFQTNICNFFVFFKHLSSMHIAQYRWVQILCS